MECTGVTVFDLGTMLPIHIDSISTNSKYTHGKRLYEIAKFIHEIKERYPPESISIERGFTRHNTSTQVIYRVHGLVNYLFHDIEQYYYSPKEVKEVVDSGDATKRLVQEIIKYKFPQIKFKNEDESDSFAVGICHLTKTGKLKWEKLNTKELIELKKKIKKMVGIFENEEQYKMFEATCKICKRYRDGRCSILTKAKKGKHQQDIIENACNKYKNKK